MIMNWFAVVNFIFVFLSWKWANEAFSRGHNIAGWINIFASALNAAAVASILF